VSDLPRESKSGSSPGPSLGCEAERVTGPAARSAAGDLAPIKQCLVAFAGATCQYLWPVALAADATIGDAIEAARRQAQQADVPWDSAPVGIFGERHSRADLPADGDRIELYRALRDDPRQRRRAKAGR
jgi:putative ubiquitin-RnfH superfamily antitoxin RatB of RatAB toxin-antitoxin module